MAEKKNKLKPLPKWIVENIKTTKDLVTEVVGTWK